MHGPHNKVAWLYRTYQEDIQATSTVRYCFSKTVFIAPIGGWLVIAGYDASISTWFGFP
jgi:hypothetical protein